VPVEEPSTASKPAVSNRSKATNLVQSELRDVLWIGLDLTSLDALDDVSQHIVGAQLAE
jgi:hypothetical protein